MQVFLSYRRNHTKWVATALRLALQERGVDVFMDVESIDSGRFETVLANEISRREHFVVLLSSETAGELGTEGDWVSKEIDRALELRKNVVPVRIDGARPEDVSQEYGRRVELISLNFASLPDDLFEAAVNTLVDRFLKQPTLQERDRATAEERFDSGREALEREDWQAAAEEFAEAIRRRPRAEYYNALAIAKYHQHRLAEALGAADAAIALDPFADELMKTKVDLLQADDRLEEALGLVTTWKSQAAQKADAMGRRILEQLDQHGDVVQAVRAVPELQMLYGEHSEREEVGYSLAALVGHASEPHQGRLHKLFQEWTSEVG